MWVLRIVWVAGYGTAFATQEFDNRAACAKAAEWVLSAGSKNRTTVECINKRTGEPGLMRGER
jgi:hypothetical protein